jgi:zinc transporter
MNTRSGTFEFALLLDGKGGARHLTDDEVSQWSENDGILWVDCDQNKERAQKWLQSKAGVDAKISDILLAGETRPRSIPDVNGLAVILRGINMNPGALPDDMVAIRIRLEKRRIITSHRRDLLSVSDLRDDLGAGDGPKTAGEFLISLASCLSGRIGAAIENVEQLVEAVESDVVSGNIGDLRSSLSVVRRQAAAIRRYLSPQRDALERLVRTHGEILSESEIYYLREEGDVLTRQLEDLDLAREQALVAQEELMNRFAQEQNSRMYLLSVVAAIFLPLTFITGLFGMNVAGLPGTENPNGFAYSATLMILCGIVLAIYFKWKKWI